MLAVVLPTFVGAVAALTALACLPDLRTRDEARDATVVSLCGNGRVDIDASETCDPATTEDAGALGCGADCRVICTGYLDSDSQHCYFEVDPASTYSEALASCEAQRAHVVTFGTPGEYQRVSQALLTDQGDAIWVGLSLVAAAAGYQSSAADEPGWLPIERCPGCYGEFLPDGGIPRLPRAGAGACVGAHPAVATWFQLPCFLPAQEKVRVICEREPLGRISAACDSGRCAWTRVTKSRKRYVIVKEPASRAAAEARCGALGGRLVVLESREEREELFEEARRELGPDTTVEAWIGLYRIADAGASTANDAWRWEDGQSLATSTYPVPWGDGQPATSTAARAFVVLGEQSYDVQLARADGSDVARPFICEH